MRTEEKYEEMGFIKLGEGKVQDRHGGVYYPKKAKNPQKAIKLFCRECMGMDRRERSDVANVELVRDCTDPMCPLFDFRLGKNPFYKNAITEEQRKARSERMSLLHASTKASSAQDENQRKGLKP